MILLHQWLPFYTSPQSRGNAYNFTHFTRVIWGRSDKHRFQVVLSKRPFNYEDHKITWHQVKTGGEMVQREFVDGYLSWWPASAPETESSKALRSIHSELYRFRVVVNKHEWPVPKRLWRACFDQDIEWPGAVNVSMPSSNEVCIRAYAGDGASSYWVTWHVYKDGHTIRKLRGGEDYGQSEGKTNP